MNKPLPTLIIVVVMSFAVFLAAPYITQMLSVSGQWNYLDTNNCQNLKPTCNEEVYTTEYPYGEVYFDNPYGNGGHDYQGHPGYDTNCGEEYVYRRAACYPKETTEISYAVTGYVHEDTSYGPQINANVRCESTGESKSDDSSGGDYRVVFDATKGELPFTVECTASKSGYLTKTSTKEVSDLKASETSKVRMDFVLHKETENLGCLENHNEGEKRDNHCEGDDRVWEECVASGEWSDTTLPGDCADEDEEESGCTQDRITSGTDTGQCQQLIKECQNGQMVVVQERITPTDEVCNDKDDNCDGEIDEIEECRPSQEEDVWMILNDRCVEKEYSEVPETKQAFSTQQGCEESMGSGPVIQVPVWNPDTGSCIKADASKIPSNYEKLPSLLWNKNPSCGTVPYNSGLPFMAYVLIGFTIPLIGAVYWKRKEIRRYIYE